MITLRLDDHNAISAGAANEQITRLEKIQNNTAWHMKKIKVQSYHTTFEGTPLASGKVPYSVQTRNTHFPSL